MAKPGRNDPCHCGSGNKYKKCCLAKDEAAERDSLVETRARRHHSAAARPLPSDRLVAEVAAYLRRAEEEDAYEDELDAASNAVVQLVGAGKLDEAEAAARDLLLRFPDVHDGWDRLGMVHETRGDPPCSTSSPSSSKHSIRQSRPNRPAIDPARRGRRPSHHRLP